jgi:hypothetical protein
MPGAFVREFLTKYSFDVNEGPINRMNRALATAGDRMKTAFTRKPIDATTGKVIEAEKAMKNLSDAAGDVGQAFSRVAIAMAAIGAAAGGIFLLAKSTADVGDEVAKTSKSLGIAVEDLQRFRYAADLSGVSTESLDQSLKILSRNMNDAKKGSGETFEAFMQLHLSFQDANGTLRDTGALLLDAADRFKGMQDGPTKAALAMKLFGRDGARLIPFLNEGSKGIRALMNEADSLGIVLSTETAAASEVFNDTISRLTASLRGLKFIVGATILPIFQQWMDATMDFIQTNRELINTRTKEWAEGLGKTMKYVFSALKGGIAIVGLVAKAFGGWDKFIKILTISLLAFGGAKILIAIGTLGKSLWVLVKSIRAVGIAAKWTQIQLFAIPLAIGAAVVAAALLIDDIITFFTDPEVETATGHFVEFIKETWNAAVQFIQDSLDSIKGFMVEVGASIIEDLAAPLEKVLLLINRAVKGFTGFDVLESIGWKTGEEGVQQRRNIVQGAADFVTAPIAEYDTGMRAGVAKPRPVPTLRAPPPINSRPILPPSPEMRAATVTAAAASSAGMTTNIENKVEINANGLSEQAAKDLATQQFLQGQKELFRKAGNNSIPKIRE